MDCYYIGNLLPLPCDGEKGRSGLITPSSAAYHSIKPLPMMLPLDLTVGEAAKYNSARVNTLRRSLDGNHSPITRGNSGDRLV